MVRSTLCTVCGHQEIDAINEKLVTGRPINRVAEEYDLGVMSVQRHRKKHLPAELLKARALKEADSADQLLERVEELYKTALRIMEKAESDKKYAPAVAAVKEARGSLELFGKLIGQLKTGTTVNLMYSPQFIQVRQEISEALIPYPEAREAVLLALEKGDATEDVDFEEID